MSTVLAVAACYAYMKKPMKLLWGPGKEPLNCVHIEDIAGAMWAAALWMDPLGRKQANALGGEEILFLNDKKSVIDIPGVVPFETKLVAPLFNIVGTLMTVIYSVLTYNLTGRRLGAHFEQGCTNHNQRLRDYA